MDDSEPRTLAVLWERVLWLNKNADERRVETMRRLDELNHAHAQAQERNRTYIPRETFEQKIESVQQATDEKTAETERQLERIRALVDQRHDETFKEIDRRSADLRTNIDGIKKLLYMGVGILLALQGLMWLFIIIVDNIGLADR